MVKQPAAIIIVRHGTRLDQVDKNWRATAEHPYDPPLSYGGWIQCQTLGARIERELLSLEQQVTPADLEREDHGEGASRPRKKRRIIIHSSPYKRCVQTSIAIAAGLRYPAAERVRPLPTPFQQRTSISTQRTSVTSNTSESEVRPSARSQPAEAPEKDERNEKIELKIDPYLGEWLSASYFEDSKPPPSTDVIVRRAKETMTKPLEEIRGADLNAFLPVPESAETERENELPANVSTEKGGLRAMAAAGHSLPHRTRTTSFGLSGASTASAANQPAMQRLRQRSRTVNVYSPPLPQYALAPQDPIPAGYVAHARDGCVNPDISWDSSEMGWGDAGVYPEEWSSMHVRFRLGLQKMLAYYDTYAITNPTPSDKGHDVNDDVVLLFVTHQAGANALIRLMTGAPALHDVGVASLTLAVRRPVLRRPPSLAGSHHSPLGYDRENRKNARRGSLDLGLADEFEMRIIASTEHLRTGSNPLGLNSPRLGQSPAMSGRRLAGADSLEGFSIGDSLGWRPNSSGGLGRSSSQRGRPNEAPPRAASNTGLWGSPAFSATAKQPIKEDIEELAPMSPKSRPTTPGGSDGIPDSSLSSPATRSRSSTVQSAGLWGSNNASLAVRSASGGTWTPSGSSDGAWGSGSVSRNRSPAKRRWTAVSNSP